MPTPLVLDIYLNNLARCLGNISISEKAEIITEVKTRVLETYNKDTNQKVESIISSLGDPQTVANRYLMERGLKPTIQKRPSFLMWLTLIFLGTTSLFLITIFLIIWKFSPVFEFNDGKFKFFGGNFNITDTGWDDFNIDAHIQGFDDSEYTKSAIAGSHDVVSKNIKVVEIHYQDAAMRLKSTDSHDLDFKCVVTGRPESEVGTVENNIFKLDLGDSEGAKCKLNIPKNMQVVLRGHNGALNIDKARFSLDAELHNAKVKIEPEDSLKYRYDLKANNGKIDDFTSFDSPDALEIKIKIHNGVISKD